MANLLDIFAQNILPIFLVAGLGFLMRRLMAVGKKAVSTVTFYAFSPALVFSSLVTSQVDGSELLQLVAFTVAITLAMGLIALLASRLLRLGRKDTIALLLVVMFVNSGNYGLTLNELRYGQAGLSRAIVFFVTSTIIVYSLGIFVASMGSANWRNSAGRLFRLPAFYAVVFSLAVYWTDVQVPEPLMRGIEVAGAGAIPLMLIVLGMQIADLKSFSGVWLAGPATLLRLVVAPLLAVPLAAWLNLQGVGRSAAIIEASMPTAVITTILATEFDVKPGLVTSTVVLTTLISAVTLPLVISLLGL
ncbi:MAG: AEC family transporter [Candidatus Promineifilaceae bacterium]|nr:AEC family transporter [Candidatus Promineifilaceae bacterium]